MLLPPAVEDFLNTSFDPDVEGYEADTSLSTNANDSTDTRSSTPVMTPSDDFMLDPKNWSSIAINRSLRSYNTTILPRADDPSSVTEPESEPDAPTTILPHADDPSSVTEPESEPDAPTTILPHADDPSSVTEPESEPDAPTTAPPIVLAPICDSDSVTEPESEPDAPTTAPSTVATPYYIDVHGTNVQLAQLQTGGNTYTHSSPAPHTQSHPRTRGKDRSGKTPTNRPVLTVQTSTTKKPTKAGWQLFSRDSDGSSLQKAMELNAAQISVITGFTAPTSPLRYRILGFSALFAICVRLTAMSTVCREEQHPYCTVTFYASESSSAPPLTTLLLAFPIAIAVPRVVRRMLQISKSDSGLAATFIPLLFAPSLIAGMTFWMLEWVDSAQVLGDKATTRVVSSSVDSSTDGSSGVDSQDILNIPNIGFGSFQVYPDQETYGPYDPNLDPLSGVDTLRHHALTLLQSLPPPPPPPSLLHPRYNPSFRPSLHRSQTCLVSTVGRIPSAGIHPRVLDFDNKRNHFAQQLHHRPHPCEHQGTLQLNVHRYDYIQP
ncbi:hypothetical protein P692DRAFT_20823419 [Suillus brevipes Sb2]|nr:hypothetical protein P692DRAFT_20823419 [Suillus brevipes Sb2]